MFLNHAVKMHDFFNYDENGYKVQLLRRKNFPGVLLIVLSALIFWHHYLNETFEKFCTFLKAKSNSIFSCYYSCSLTGPILKLKL